MTALYIWLKSIEAFSGVAGAFLLAISAPVAALLFARASASQNQTFFTLSLVIPEELSGKEFFVRHIRDGAAPWPGGQAYKEDLQTMPPRPALQRSVKLRFPRRVGVLFKPYVDAAGMNTELVKAGLERVGYTDITEEHRADTTRVWFIVPRYLTVRQSGSGIIDNFYVD